MERLARLQKEMSCQAAIVLSGVNRFYLTGFASSAGYVGGYKRTLVFPCGFPIYPGGKGAHAGL